MWDRIHFTPEEEHALEEAERAIARRRWEELGISPPEGDVPPKKKPRRRSTQRDLEALFARIEALMDAAPPDPPPAPEYLAWLERCRQEGEAFVEAIKRRQAEQEHRT
jgi:hypothetical protein